jgi:hypothetical protein
MRGHTIRPVRGDLAGTLSGHDGRDVSRCFADEVVVDFPSVAPALDRIRRAFLSDDRPALLVASVHVTARDADIGVTLPITVPVQCTCSGCGGRGESWTDLCAVCAGSGSELRSHQLQVTVPAGIEDGTLVHFAITPPHHPTTRIELRIDVG